MLFTKIEDSAIAAGVAALSDSFPDSLVILAHQNGTEPSSSYAVVNIINIPQQGRSNTSTLADKNEQLHLQSVYGVLVQYSFLGSEAGNMAHHFSNRISNNPVVQEELQKVNLSYMRKSTIRRIPEKRETRWVEKFNIDITFSYRINTNQQIEIVESAILEDVLSGNTFTISALPTPP